VALCPDDYSLNYLLLACPFVVHQSNHYYDGSDRIRSECHGFRRGAIDHAGEQHSGTHSYVLN
jgi:hypothetical protein